MQRVAAHWTPVVAQELSEIGIHTPDDLLVALMLGPREVARITRDVAPHVDDIPSVEYESGRVIDRNWTWYQTFRLLVANLSPLNEAVSGASVDVAEQRRARLMGMHLRIAAEVVRRERGGR